MDKKHVWLIACAINFGIIFRRVQFITPVIAAIPDESLCDGQKNRTHPLPQNLLACAAYRGTALFVRGPSSGNLDKGPTCRFNHPIFQVRLSAARCKQGFIAIGISAVR